MPAVSPSGLRRGGGDGIIDHRSAGLDWFRHRWPALGWLPLIRQGCSLV
jgi:hypothetical protein